MWQTADRTRRARGLRRDMTPAELKLWDRLRDRRFDGLKFRRQVPVAGAVADFLCAELRLVVELDGGVHRLRETEDAARDARLAVAGFVVLRETNEAFERNPNALLGRVRQLAAERRKGRPQHKHTTTHQQTPRGGCI